MSVYAVVANDSVVDSEGPSSDCTYVQSDQGPSLSTYVTKTHFCLTHEEA